MPRPDFSAVTTRAKAERLVAQGRLVRVLLFPAEVGGPDTPENRGYLPPAVEEVRAEFIASLIRMTERGELDSLEVEPDYKGDSIVPSAIRMIASKRGKKGAVDATIEVW